MIDKEPIIRVGIMSDSTIDFVLNGVLQKVSIENNQILFQGKKFDDLRFTAKNADDFFELKNVTIGKQFHWERAENQRFKGDLHFIVENSKITAINEILVEDYLASVISSEMSATASDELLKAHAVISRSWLLAGINQKGKKAEGQKNNNCQLSIVNYQLTKWYERDLHQNFDVCADDHCQRYQGITRQTTKRVQQAIDNTRGQVLVSEGAICDARFSKSCGGATELFENCWADIHHSYLEKVLDAPHTIKEEESSADLSVEKNAEKWLLSSPDCFCNTKDEKILLQILNSYDRETADFFRWQVEYSQAEISEIIARKSGIDFGEIVDLIPVKRGVSGRIVELKIVGTKRTFSVGKELEIRKWLSNSHLYSSAFAVEKYSNLSNVPQKFVLRGAGWGHGVGLCQIGAAVMGERGYSYEEILLHYFKNASLEKIY